MATQLTQVLSDQWDVDRRLAALALNRQALLRVRNAAIGDARNTTPDHCANAFGTYAYQAGTFSLRQQICGSDYKRERPNGVEAIWNEKLQVRVVFSNVDLACNSETEPTPRSDKGSGAESVCSGNLFGTLPRYVQQPHKGEATYYLMMDSNGALELSRPVISNKTFSAFIERIFLSDGSDCLEGGIDLAGNDIVDGFDPQVLRKR